MVSFYRFKSIIEIIVTHVVWYWFPNRYYFYLAENTNFTICIFICFILYFVKKTQRNQVCFNYRRNLRGSMRVLVPHILDWGVQYVTPLWKTVKNLLSPAVNRSDLRRLNYNKSIFGPGSLPTQLGQLTAISSSSSSSSSSDRIDGRGPLRLGVSRRRALAHSARMPKGVPSAICWSHELLPDPKVRWVGDTSSPFSSPFVSGPKGASLFFWICIPTFQTKVTPLVLTH